MRAWWVLLLLLLAGCVQPAGSPGEPAGTPVGDDAAVPAPPAQAVPPDAEAVPSAPAPPWTPTRRTYEIGAAPPYAVDLVVEDLGGRGPPVRVAFVHPAGSDQGSYVGLQEGRPYNTWRHRLPVPEDPCADGPCSRSVQDYMAGLGTHHWDLVPTGTGKAGRVSYTLTSTSTGSGIPFIAYESEGSYTYLLLEAKEGGGGQGAAVWTVTGSAYKGRSSCAHFVLVIVLCDGDDPVPVAETVADPIRFRFDPSTATVLDGTVPRWAASIPGWWFLPPGAWGHFTMTGTASIEAVPAEAIARTLNEEAVQHAMAGYGALTLEAGGAMFGDKDWPLPPRVEARIEMPWLDYGIDHRWRLRAFDEHGAPAYDDTGTPRGGSAWAAFEAPRPGAWRWEGTTTVFGREAGRASAVSLVALEAEGTEDCLAVAVADVACKGLRFPVSPYGDLTLTLAVDVADRPLDGVQVLDAAGAVVFEEEVQTPWSGTVDLTAGADHTGDWTFRWTAPAGSAHVSYAVQVSPAYPAGKAAGR